MSRGRVHIRDQGRLRFACAHHRGWGDLPFYRGRKPVYPHPQTEPDERYLTAVGLYFILSIVEVFISSDRIEDPMIKKIVVFASFAVFALGLAGCSNSVKSEKQIPARQRIAQPSPTPEEKRTPGDLLVDQAIELIEHGSKGSTGNPYKKMIGLLEEALTRDSENDRFYFQLARLYSLAATYNEKEEDMVEDKPKIRQMFEKAIEKSPGNIEALSEYASFLSAHGSREDKVYACQLLGKVLEVQPDRLSAYFDLAMNLKKMNDYAQSREILQKAEKIIRNAPKSKGPALMRYDDLGSLYREIKEYDKAESILKDGAKLANESGKHLEYAQIITELGRVYTESGEFEAAEKAFYESAQRMKSNGVGENSYWGCLYHAFGALYAEMKQNNQACVSYMESADREEVNYIRQFEASLACYLSGDNANALKYADRAIMAEENRLTPDVRIKIVKGFALLTESRSDEAQTIFEEIKENQYGAGAYVGLGRIHLTAHRLRKARRHLKLGLKIHQRTPVNTIFTGIQREYNLFIEEMALLDLGFVSVLEKKYGEAFKYFNRVLEIRPDNIAALLAKGNDLGRREKYVEAIATINKVFELSPNNARALSELALIHFNSGDLKKAEQYFSKARDAGDQGYTCPYEGLGLVYLRQGRVEEAKANLQKAIEINPDVEYKKFNALAKIFLKEGKKGKAKELLEKSIANNPHDNEARKLLAGNF
jgi:tetratricopeptide (TPR) repeat protein